MGDNAATLAGNKQAPTGPLKCGDVGTYREMRKRKTNRQERDHVPATASMLLAGQAHQDGLTADQVACFERFVKMDALTIAIPKGTHVKYSRTCKGRGGRAREQKDAEDVTKAANDDFDAVEPYLSPECAKKYAEAKEKVLAQLPDKLFKECKAKAVKEC
jgi:hypothetical protein